MSKSVLDLTQVEQKEFMKVNIPKRLTTDGCRRAFEEFGSCQRD